MGTPAFAVPCLEALHAQADVVLVVCQPDRPSGRGLKLTPPPVKVAAEDLGLPVAQPTKVRTAAFAEELRALNADIALVVAYGRILPQRVLDAPRLGCVNVHASLLPELRGAAPIQWAIVRGHQQAGVCLMQMDAGMDTGPELARRVVDIGPDETGGELSERLSALGAAIVQEDLPKLFAGELVPRPQDHEAATVAPLLSKSDGLVDFARPAQAVHDRVRGLSPWPGAFTMFQGARLKVHGTHLVTADGCVAAPGTVIRADRHGIEVACGQGVVALDVVQPAGRKRLTAREFLAGHRVDEGTLFGDSRSDGDSSSDGDKR